jgi:HAD superfamily hydrolase (TIGR01509 family)
MDGTIVNSLPFHKLAWIEMFGKRGVVFSDTDFEWANGRKNEVIIPHIMKKVMTPEEVNPIADEKEATFRRLLKGKIQALPGVIELMKALTEAGFPMAIVSSTPKANIDLISESLGMAKYFKLFINGDDVKEGKPSPQCFLLGAERLGIQPENCLVMEDAIVGVRAAKRAGMYCLGITNTCPREHIAEADIVVDSLTEINVKTIEGLFSSPIKKLN